MMPSKAAKFPMDSVGFMDGLFVGGSCTPGACRSRILYGLSCSCQE